MSPAIVSGIVAAAIGQFFAWPWGQSQNSFRKITRPSFLVIFILMTASTIFYLTDPVFVSTCNVTLTQHILFLTGSFRASSRGSCPCCVFGAPAQI